MTMWTGVLRVRSKHGQSGQRQAKGFTLIEMLVALVILAVASVAIYGRSGQAVSTLYSLEQRTLANWIAQDQLTRMRLNRRFSQDPLLTGRDSQELFSGGRLWAIDTDVLDTDVETMWRVEVAVAVVSQETGKGDPRVTAVGFLGQY